MKEFKGLRMMSTDSSVRKFFKFLEKKSITPDKVKDTLSSWGTKHLGEFIEECKELVPFSQRKSGLSSVFDFAANHSLSGDIYPCSALGCRLSNVDELGRFAALYADHVLVLNPLRLHIPDKFESIDQKILMDDISVLYRLKPLLESGILELAPRTLRLCRECFNKLKRTELQVKRKVRELIAPRIGEFRIEIESVEELGKHVLKIDGPEELLSHSPQMIIPAEAFCDIHNFDNLEVVLDSLDPSYFDITPLCQDRCRV
jgi:DNA-binding transcriptional ArsR family regulator